MRAINRPGSQLLGANGRDDGPIVSINKTHTSISASCKVNWGVCVCVWVCALPLWCIFIFDVV